MAAMPAYNPCMSSEYPVSVACPQCHQQVTSNVTYVSGALMWIIVIVLLLVFFPVACIPCCVDACKDVHHYCPNCNAFLGVKKRI